MTKAGNGMICLAFLALCMGSTSVFAQETDLSKQFLIDVNRPFVYVKFDHVGPGAPRGRGEADTRIWLRLTNNCRVPILVQANGVPDESPKDEIGLMYEVVANRPVNGLLIAVGPEASGKSGERKNERQQNAETEQESMPRGTMSEVGSLIRIDPGEDVLFSMPVNHFSDRWHVEIPISFELPSGKVLRDPNKWGGEPKVKVFYGLWDLPTKLEKELRSN